MALLTADKDLNSFLSEATVRTIDGYQGKEKDVIIVSFARCNTTWDLGMMDDVRRINVAITRARRLCCIVGDTNTFSYDENYALLIKGLKKKKCVVPLREYQQIMQKEGFQIDNVEGSLKFDYSSAFDYFSKVYRTKF